jgi:hypothetical protein
MKTALLVLFFGSIFAFGQDDAGMMAAQQAAQISQQASQQAMQDMQQASQTAQQAQQQAMQNAQSDTGLTVALTRQPIFTIHPGAAMPGATTQTNRRLSQEPKGTVTVTPGTAVRIKCATHYAVIYYTTNGWTPTTASRRYKGPILINATTQLQAIAIAPNMARSLITRATYTVLGPATPAQPLVLSADGVLHAGTRLHLVTNSTVNSKTAEVGDTLSLLLDQEIKVGNAIIAPKGASIDATITQADSSGHMGTPGDIAFEVHSMTVHETTVPLRGGETLEGADHYGRMKGLMYIPVVGATSMLLRGDEAEIKPGMTFTVAVAADTALKP